MKTTNLEYADERVRTMPDGPRAQFLQARSLIAAGALCCWCSTNPATIARGGRAWCRGCADGDRIVRKHQQERGE